MEGLLERVRQRGIDRVAAAYAIAAWVVVQAASIALPAFDAPAWVLRWLIVTAITGASGALYAQRLLDHLDPVEHEVHVVLSNYAHTVVNVELPGGLRLRPGVTSHGLKSMNAPFASGSNPVAKFAVGFVGLLSS